MTHKIAKKQSKLLIILIFLFILLSSTLLSYLYFSRLKSAPIASPFKSILDIISGKSSYLSRGKVQSPSTSGSGTGQVTVREIRTFEITAKNGQLSSEKITADQYDIVRISFSAADKKYDLALPSLGLKTQANKGETKLIEFQAVSSGSFEFLCGSCGKNAKGILLVAAKT